MNTNTGTVLPQNLQINSDVIKMHMRTHLQASPSVRSGIYFGDVQLEGYSNSDLNQYYTGTVMGYTFKGKILPAFVMELQLTDAGTKASVLVVDADNGRLRVMNKTVLLRNLKRFLVTPSFIISASGSVMYLRYDCRKSYKKSAVLQMIRFQELSGRNIGTSTEGIVKLLYCWMYPLRSSVHAEHAVHIISDNVVRINNTVRIPYNNYRVGSYDGTELSTPFPALQERFQDYQRSLNA
jgi:hypothetical protein